MKSNARTNSAHFLQSLKFYLRNDGEDIVYLLKIKKLSICNLPN